MDIDLRQALANSTHSPQKILKIVISISVALLVLWLFMVSRMEFTGNTSQPANPVKKEQTESLQTMRKQQSLEDVTTEKEGPSMANPIVIFLVMLFLLGVVWLWSRTKTNSRPKMDQFREVGNYTLGQGAEIKMVEINEEIWVIGVTPSAINLLHRYPKKVWTEEIAETDSKSTALFYKFFRN